jgi:hypothetical protein
LPSSKKSTAAKSQPASQRVPEGQKLLARANQRVPARQKLLTRASHRVPGRVDEWPRPQDREPGGYFPFAVAPFALSKPWGHVLMHNVMTPGKQKLVITDLGLKRAKINSDVAFY